MICHNRVTKFKGATSRMAHPHAKWLFHQSERALHDQIFLNLGGKYESQSVRIGFRERWSRHFLSRTSFKEAPWCVREVRLGFLSDPPVEAEDWTLSFRASALLLCTWPECGLCAGFVWSSGGGITGSLWDFSTLLCTWMNETKVRRCYIEENSSGNYYKQDKTEIRNALRIIIENTFRYRWKDQWAWDLGMFSAFKLEQSLGMRLASVGEAPRPHYRFRERFPRPHEYARKRYNSHLRIREIDANGLDRSSRDEPPFSPFTTKGLRFQMSPLMRFRWKRSAFSIVVV